MRILILNRRDITNPFMGGAEIYTHEIAKGLVDRYKSEVTVFSSRFKKGLALENLDGVNYIRRGNEISVHIFGFMYALKHRHKYDLIIDEFNGIGFFTFFLPQCCILAHQLYRELWIAELGILGLVPYVLEPLLVWFYRRKPLVTISNSSRRDFRRLGFKDITVIMVATKHILNSSRLHEKKYSTLIFLGRLRRTKRPQDAIRLFEKVKAQMPEVKLWMVGSGPEEGKLKKQSLNIEGITFWGWVADKEKMEFLKEASVLLVPSIREGFGINVVEAARVGTPAVGYDVAGLKDSILHGKTGFRAKDVTEAAHYVCRLIGNKVLYEEMSGQCVDYAKDFSWDKRVDEFWERICLRFSKIRE